MPQAAEVYSREFDARFLELPASVRELIIAKVREMGRRLEDYPHCRLRGRPEFRLRAGDYRIIYDFDGRENVVFLVALGHRRKVYRR